MRKIAWRVQALAERDLTERARRRAEELANDADIRLMPPRRHQDAGDGPAGGTRTLDRRFRPKSSGDEFVTNTDSDDEGDEADAE